MATQGKRAWKYVGSAALTGGEVLKWTAKDTVDVATAVTDKVVGVAAEACAAGNVTAQNISVLTESDMPTVQVIASAPITAGAYLTMAAGGKVVTAAAAGAAPAYEVILGFANEAAAADLDVIEMVWQKGTMESQA